VIEPRAPHEPATLLPAQLREIFEAHGAFVCRSLRYLGVREADLDDATQDVFLVVYERLRDYDEKGRVRAWLYSICTRVARAHRRKIVRRRESSPPGFFENAVGPTQLERVEDREALTLGHRLLSRLPAAQREVFLLYEVEGMPMPEIARALACPLQTAYSRLHMARTRIVAMVERSAAETDVEALSAH
jgi:RNA polymerase sigma-70 factor (ECF subfamily)